jgi:tetratricopeptide (TPR) repeat protein
VPEILLLGRILARQGWFVFQLGQREESEELLRRSLNLLRGLDQAGRSEMVFSLNYLAAVQRHAGRYDEARQQVEESITICEEFADGFGLSIALNNLGQIAYALGDYSEAKIHCQQSLDLARSLNHRWGIAFSLTSLGQVAFALTEYRQAEQLFRESLEIRRQINDRRGIAICYSDLGDVALALGAYAEAKQRHQEGLDIFAEIGNQWGSTNAVTKLGEVAWNEGEYQVARRYLVEALRTATEIQATPLILNTLVGVAMVLVKTGQAERALEILALIMHNPNSSRENQNKAAGLLTELVAAELPTEVATTAQERGKALDLDSFVPKLVAEMSAT